MTAALSRALWAIDGDRVIGTLSDGKTIVWTLDAPNLSDIDRQSEVAALATWRRNPSAVLTRKQRAVLEAIRALWAEAGRPPTAEQIKDRAGIGDGYIYQALHMLVDLGHLVKPAFREHWETLRVEELRLPEHVPAQRSES